MLRTKETPAPSMRRLTAVFLAMAVILGIFGIRLFQVQIVQGEHYASLADADTKTTISIAASRGEILDRNQIPIVSNRTSYAVTLDYNYFPHGTTAEEKKEQNDCLLRLTALLTEQGEEWNDTLPITSEKPYAFTEEREADVERLKTQFRMATYATADNCMQRMIEEYALEDYTEREQRYLAGIHYGMVQAGFRASSPYTFASSISSTTMYKLLENSTQYPGVDVGTVPVREYTDGTVACHVIGRVGPIYAEEYAERKEKGYSFNDTLGKEGIELAAEDHLRGKAGRRTLVKNSSGTVISEEQTQAPTPGDTVILALDAKLQKVAQDTLDEKIQSLRATAGEGKGKDVKSGSVVMLDIKTGGVMVCASWPGFDISRLSADYEELDKNTDRPLFNRALAGAFPCGSTFKPGVALAAITEGVITPSTVINCTHTYTYYAPSYTPSCMGWHHDLTVVTALQKSCNFFFYDVGRRMGSTLFGYLSLYGFGQTTGVELERVESAGTQQTPEYLQSIGSTWVPGDYLQLAIGQRGAYTPIQLAAYTMMIANKGVRYKTHFIDAYRKYDSDADEKVEPVVAAEVEWSQAAMDAVHAGMVAVGKAGTASAYFAATPYTVACKTGTAETGIRGSSDHGTFIAYAPADDPQIAIAVVMERGTSGASTYVARQVLDAYFATKETGDPVTESNVLLP